MDYKPTIGLEIHAELKTKTKMFCSCKNDADEKQPNKNICPICLGHPGTLPVINKEAVKHLLRVGTAISGKISNQSEFDRKNYFYPDIPKGYQISQYKYPFVTLGELSGVKITRVHLEEDTARSLHFGEGYSLVDFNRAGLPLMELVTEPVIHTSQKVSEFGEELQKLLQYLGVSDANMEKGQMRLEANISVSNSNVLGTKVEVKNLNSFRSAERAIEYEIKRQIKILESGERVTQETRGFDDSKQITFSQRKKESSHDYRYFPDPDLPKIELSEVEDFSYDSIKSEIRETPSEKRARLKTDFGIKESDIEFYISNKGYSTLFENAATIVDRTNFQTLSNFIVSDIKGLGENGLLIKPDYLAQIVKMFVAGEVSSRGAKDILAKVVNEGVDPVTTAKEYGLFQKNDEEEMLKLAKEIISKNEAVANEYKNGKSGAIQFLLGQAMKATKGSVNPQVIRAIFEKLLS